jgi:nucleoid DNA-binding protein
MGDYFIRTRVSRTQGPRLTYPGFGTFSKRRRPPRMVKNPKTGVPITIPQQETITFSPGQELRSLLNRNGKSESKSDGRSAAAPPAKSASGSR